MGVLFDNVTMEQALDRAETLMEAKASAYCVTPNGEIVWEAMQDPAFRSILNEADLVLPDGAGVVLGSRILERPLQEKVAGIAFAEALVQRMAARGGRLYLLGGRPGIAEKAAENLTAKYPGLVICGTADGYFRDEAAVVEQVRKAEPDVLFVCLGAPKQEKWISRFGLVTGAKLAIGLGGALDVFAGNVERAPEQWQKAGMEWAYRLKKEPKRIGRMAKLPLVLVKAAGRRVAGKGRQGVL